MKKNIALVAGGYSSEYVVSLKSAESVYQWLDHDQFDIYRVILTRESWTAETPEGQYPVNLSDFSVNTGKKTIRFDFAYIIIHGTPGEDGKLQGYFDMLGIPYSTCGVLSASLTFNKFFTKTYLEPFGVLSAACRLVKMGEQVDPASVIDELGLPCFVKPNNGGSSFGVSKITSLEEMDEALQKAGKEDEEIIIESFLQGTELTCGLVRIGRKIIVFPVTEVVPKNEFFDYEAKYVKGMADEITPARIPADVSKACQDLSAMIYDKLNCRGIVRVDYILSSGKLYMLEVNTIPGMTATSFIPQQIKAMGWKVEEVLNKLVNSILEMK